VSSREDLALERTGVEWLSHAIPEPWRRPDHMLPYRRLIARRVVSATLPASLNRCRASAMAEAGARAINNL
jgi:hypothetical protein